MSSRQNKRRMSMGGGALRQSSSKHNRRTSLAPAGTLPRSPTRAKDRRVVLEDFRYQQPQQKYQRENDPSFVSSYQSTISGRPLVQVNAGESSALARFRARKQQQLQEKQQQQHPSSSFSSPFTNISREEDNHGYVAPPSPIPNRHMVDPRSATRLSARVGLQHDTDHLARSDIDQTHHLSSSQEATIVGSVETHARYEEMQRRLRKLEEEKMDITIAMAPMEARHRQKEETWTKEQRRLLQEIETMKNATQVADERYRDLAAQYDAKEQENRQLRTQIRKESSTVHSVKSSEIEGEGSQYVQVEEELKELKQKYKNAMDDIKTSRLSRVSVEKELHATKMELESMAKAFEELQEAHDEISRVTSIDQEAQIKLDVLTEEHIATSAQLNAVRSDLAAFTAAFEVQMEERKVQHEEEIEHYQFELSVLKTRCAEEGVRKSTTTEGVEDFAVLKARIEERDRKIAEFEKERLNWETLRREMHNRIQELSGNIRVFVRTRPFLPNDGPACDSAIDVSLDGESLTILDGRTQAPFDFKFDKVFAPSAGQDNVFGEVKDFVQSAADGYSVCIFSYGQTGSGKTHTMQGSGNGAMRGIIPRAVEQILQQAQNMQAHGWAYSLSASFLEIYNEELKDLLVEMVGGSRKDPPKLAVKRGRDGKSFVENLAEVPIETTDSYLGMSQLEQLMKVAARSRSVASTKMNAQSSRSHSVFMLHLSGYNAESGVEVRGALNLCDLAGSERLDRSGAGSSTVRLRETQAINKSLSCLGDVFNALAQKSSHIPFRNSKLTYLLQDCLSGDGKALMFVNLSPTTESSNESVCSLRFAQRVNQVELGKAKKQVSYSKR